MAARPKKQRGMGCEYYYSTGTLSNEFSPWRSRHQGSAAKTCVCVCVCVCVCTVHVCVCVRTFEV